MARIRHHLCPEPVGSTIIATVHECREQKCPSGQWQIDWRKQLPTHVQKDKYNAVQAILQEVITLTALLGCRP